MLKGRYGLAAAVFTLMAFPGPGSGLEGGTDAVQSRNPALPSQDDLVKFNDSGPALPANLDSHGANQRAFPLFYGAPAAAPGTLIAGLHAQTPAQQLQPLQQQFPALQQQFPDQGFTLPSSMAEPFLNERQLPQLAVTETRVSAGVSDTLPESLRDTGRTFRTPDGGITRTYMSVPVPVTDDKTAFAKAGYLDYQEYLALKQGGRTESGRETLQPTPAESLRPVTEPAEASGTLAASVASAMPHAGAGTIDHTPPTLGARVDENKARPQPSPAEDDHPSAAMTMAMAPAGDSPGAASQSRTTAPSTPTLRPITVSPEETPIVSPAPVSVTPPEQPVRAETEEPVSTGSMAGSPASAAGTEPAPETAPGAVLRPITESVPEPVPEPVPEKAAPSGNDFSDESLASHFPAASVGPPPLPGERQGELDESHPTVGLAEFKSGHALDGTPLPPPPPVPELPAKPAEPLQPKPDPAQVRADFNRLKAFCEEDSLGSAAELYARMPDFGDDGEINRLRADAANLLILGLARGDNLRAARRIYDSVPVDMPGYDATLAKTRGVINLATYYVRAERFNDAYDVLMDLQNIENRSALNNELFRLMARMIPYLDNADESDKAQRVYDMLLSEVKSPGTAALFAENMPGVLKYYLHYVDKSENPVARRRRMDFLEHMYQSMNELKGSPEVRTLRTTVGMSLADRYAGDPDRAARFLED